MSACQHTVINDLYVDYYEMTIVFIHRDRKQNEYVYKPIQDLRWGRPTQSVLAKSSVSIQVR